MKPNPDNDGSLIIPLTIIVLSILHFVPFLSPSARLWGFNHLLFLPSPHSWIFAGVFSVLLLLFFMSSRLGLGMIYQKAGNVLFPESYRLRWIILILASILFFWLMRPPIYFLGDSFSVTANIGNDLPIIYKWSEIGAIMLADLVLRILPQFETDKGILSYSIISVISGAFTIYFFLSIAKEITKDTSSRLFIFSTLIFSGWIVLFFGYTENYPILWPLLSAYIYYAIRFLDRKIGLWRPAAFIPIALFMHLQTLFFLPSFIMLLLYSRYGAQFYKRRKMFIRVLGFFILITVAAYAINLLTQSSEFRDYLIAFSPGRLPDPQYWIFSPSHLIDTVNLWILFMPLFPIFIYTTWKFRQSLMSNKINLFLSVLAIGGFLFQVMIDPKLGMGRDWDLFALTSMPVALLSVCLIVTHAGNLRKYYFVLSAFAAVISLPFVITLINVESAKEHYKYLLNLDMPRSRTGMTLLKHYYQTGGDSAAADSLENILQAQFHSYSKIPIAYELLENGKIDSALTIAEYLEKNEPPSAEIYNLKGKIYLEMGHYARAVQCFESSTSMGRYDSRLFIAMGSAYHHLLQYDKMLSALRKAQKLAPNSYELSEAFASGYYNMAHYDSAFAYSQSCIKLDSTKPIAYLIAGMSKMKLSDMESAGYYLDIFIDMSPDDEYRKQAIQTMQNINTD
ncbi:MAG: hypothetical protein ABIE07_08295 [Candidatus Zixiibacteriota bacterium]